MYKSRVRRKKITNIVHGHDDLQKCLGDKIVLTY